MPGTRTSTRSDRHSVPQRAHDDTQHGATIEGEFHSCAILPVDFGYGKMGVAHATPAAVRLEVTLELLGFKTAMTGGSPTRNANDVSIPCYDFNGSGSCSVVGADIREKQERLNARKRQQEEKREFAARQAAAAAERDALRNARQAGQTARNTRVCITYFCIPVQYDYIIP